MRYPEVASDFKPRYTTKQMDISGRRARLRQAALAWAGLGSLMLLNTFFAELDLRSRIEQAVDLGLGSLFVLASAVLLGLDIRIRGIAWSVWLARLLLVPGLWRMLVLIRDGLIRPAAPGGDGWPLLPVAALINAALLSIALVLLARAGFGHDSTAISGQPAAIGPRAEGHETEGVEAER
jgi:hypothetical protein